MVEDNRVAHRSVQTGARGQADSELLVAVQGIAAGALVLQGKLGPLREGTPVKFSGSSPPRSPSP